MISVTHRPSTLRFMSALLFALALSPSTAAHARTPRTSSRQQNAAAKPSQESVASRVTKEGDVIRAEDACARAESLSKRGDTRGALKALGESVRLYKRIYLAKREPLSAPDARSRFREEMAARLRRAPQCIEFYTRLGGPEGANDFERDQLEALRAHAAGITESDASSIIYFAAETDGRIVVTYRPPTRYPHEARRDNFVETVRLRVVLSAGGEVEHPLVLSGSESPFLEPAIEAAKGTRFKPAVKDGRPVSQFVTLEFNFGTQ